MVVKFIWCTLVTETEKVW